MRRIAAAAILALALVTGCSDDPPAAVSSVVDDGDETTTTTTAAEGTTTTEAEETTTTAAPEGLGQPVIFPAADTTFDDPVEAVQAFCDDILGAGQAGEFRQGDSRSGEVDILSVPEGGGTAVVRGTALVRQLGAGDGYFILAVVSEFMVVNQPSGGDEVATDEPLAVEGAGRGFEGAITVGAFEIGSATPLDAVPTQGGAQADVAPWSVELDLAGATAGETIVLIARGGTGLETDPGELAAIPVVVAG